MRWTTKIALVFDCRFHTKSTEGSGYSRAYSVQCFMAAHGGFYGHCETIAAALD